MFDRCLTDGWSMFDRMFGGMFDRTLLDVLRRTWYNPINSFNEKLVRRAIWIDLL